MSVRGTPQRPRIGFYAHHHGMGHLTTAFAIAAHLETRPVVLTSAEIEDAAVPAGVDLRRLCSDVPEAPLSPAAEVTARGALHWAPMSSSTHTLRAAQLVGHLVDADVGLLVVDVSVEAAVLARLAGVPVIVMRLHGARNDRAHRLGYDVAAGLLAPFPEILESLDTPTDIADRTFYAGFVSSSRRVAGSKEQARRLTGSNPRKPQLVLAVGAGGNGFEAAHLPAIAEALPGWQVDAVGIDSPPVEHARVRTIRWVEDLAPWLAGADVVAGSGGANMVAEVAAADRPFICVPEARPFEEQIARAARLNQLDAAVVAYGWPEPDEWPELVRAAEELGSSSLHRLSSSHGAARAAAWLTSLLREIREN